jgi:hypothetical protein
MSNDPRWALTEGSIFFEGRGAVQESLKRIAGRLNELQIPYAIAGGMALFRHGVRRFTEDVDILVTRDSLKKIHEELDGLGYVPPFAGSKNLRDVATGVKIEFLLAGAFPGDGKPKPVAFPDPAPAGVEREGIRYLQLGPLIELKLASGITAPARQKDLADVIALIETLRLPLEYAASLNAFVRPTFEELWRQTMAARDYDAKEESWDTDPPS